MRWKILSGGQQAFSGGPLNTDPWIQLDGRLQAPITDPSQPLYSTVRSQVGSVAFSSMLNRYHNAGSPAGRYRLRFDPADGKQYQPWWMVAGIDYPVGINKAFLPLLSPTTISTTGVTVDTTNQVVTITGPNVSLQGYDFTNWAVCIDNTGANNPINANVSNNYFKAGNKTFLNPAVGVDSLVLFGGGNGNTGPIKGLKAWYNVFDVDGAVRYADILAHGSGGTNAGVCFKSLSGQSDCDFRYNWFANAASEHLDFLCDSGNHRALVKYNCFGMSGYGNDVTGTHGDWVRLYGGGGNFDSIIVDFNSWYCDDSHTGTPVWSGQGHSLCSASANLATATDISCQYQTTANPLAIASSSSHAVNGPIAEESTWCRNTPKNGNQWFDPTCFPASIWMDGGVNGGGGPFSHSPNYGDISNSVNMLNANVQTSNTTT